jgi:hypothetical protein
MYVPSLHEFYDSNDSDTMIEALIEHVQCEVKDAIQFLVLDDKDKAQFDSDMARKSVAPSLTWLYNWAAQVTLVITVDEKSSLNPSIFVNPPRPSVVTKFSNGTTTTTPQSFSVGLGAMVSVDGTRKETISWLVKFADLTDAASLAKARVRRDYFYNYVRQTNSETFPATCNNPGRPFLEGDLELRQWIYNSLLPVNVRNGILGDFSKSISAEASTSKKDALQDEITFVVLYEGNINPVWKLVQISAGQATPPLFGVQRTRTQDLLVTVGSTTPDGTLTQAAQNQALASLIGIAVGNAIRNTQ